MAPNRCTTMIIHRTEKRWRLYISPQYLVNLTQPIGTLKVIFFYEILSCTNSIVYARFEVFKSFLCVFMSVFRVFVRNELWVKLPVAIFFGTVDCVFCWFPCGVSFVPPEKREEVAMFLFLVCLPITNWTGENLHVLIGKQATF